MTAIAKLIVASRLFVSTWAKGPGILTAKAVVDAEAALAGIPEGEPTEAEIEEMAQGLWNTASESYGSDGGSPPTWEAMGGTKPSSPGQTRYAYRHLARWVLRRERGLS